MLWLIAGGSPDNHRVLQLAQAGYVSSAEALHSARLAPGCGVELQGEQAAYDFGGRAASRIPNDLELYQAYAAIDDAPELVVELVMGAEVYKFIRSPVKDFFSFRTRDSLQTTLFADPSGDHCYPVDFVVTLRVGDPDTCRRFYQEILDIFLAPIAVGAGWGRACLPVAVAPRAAIAIDAVVPGKEHRHSWLRIGVSDVDGLRARLTADGWSYAETLDGEQLTIRLVDPFDNLLDLVGRVAS